MCCNVYVFVGLAIDPVGVDVVVLPVELQSPMKGRKRGVRPLIEARSIQKKERRASVPGQPGCRRAFGSNWIG